VRVRERERKKRREREREGKRERERERLREDANQIVRAVCVRVRVCACNLTGLLDSHCRFKRHKLCVWVRKRERV